MYNEINTRCRGEFSSALFCFWHTYDTGISHGVIRKMINRFYFPPFASILKYAQKLNSKRTGAMLKYKKITAVIRGFNQNLIRCHVGTFSAAGSFFLFLSLVPFFILLCSILPYTRITQDTLTMHISAFLPASMNTLIQNIISEVYDGPLLTLPVSFLITIWSSSKAFASLMRGIDEVYGVTEKDSFLLLRFRASLYTLLLLLAIVSTLSIMVFGLSIKSFVVFSYPKTAQVFDFLLHFRYLFMFFALALAFTCFYKWIPDKKLKITSQLPGAAFASAAWIILSHAFSFYVSHAENSGIYGSLVTIIMAMLWMYYCMYIVLLGANLNCFIAEKRQNKLANAGRYL